MPADKPRLSFDNPSIFSFNTFSSTTDLTLPTFTTSPSPPPSISIAPPAPPALITPPSVLSGTGPLPRVFVFDLDYTLWPFWVDTHPTPPLKPNSAGTACLDKYGESFAPYPDVGAILAELKSKGVIVAAASRTCAPDLARELLKSLVVDVGGRRRKMLELFDHLEIYPGSKIRHFEKIKKATGATYEDMLFFDDEARNREVESLGVTMCLVKDGLSCAEINRGVENWRLKRSFRGGERRVVSQGTYDRWL